MSAHPLPHRKSWLSLLAAHVADFVFETVEEADEEPPIELQPHPVIAIVSATRRSGASTVARLLAAELAARSGGAAVVTGAGIARRTAPPSRAAVRLSTALAGVAQTQPCGRLVLAATPPARLDRTQTAPASAEADLHPPADALAAAPAQADANSHPPADALAAAREPVEPEPARPAEGRAAIRALVDAARYLAPVVLDVPPDGSAAVIAPLADRVVVVAGASGEPPLLDAVATVIGGAPVKVANRIVEPGGWAERADLLIPDSRFAARAAVMGTRPLGPLAVAIGALADSLGAER